jgi:hypothetical protein
MKESMGLQYLLTAVRRKTDQDVSQSGESPFPVERRKHPRISVELPFDYSLFEREKDHRGILVDASEGGLLVNLLEKIEIGSWLKLEILFSRGTELMTIAAFAKVVWSDLAAKESWVEHRYGLEFLSFLQGDMDKLRMLLKEVGQRQ